MTNAQELEKQMQFAAFEESLTHGEMRANALRVFYWNEGTEFSSHLYQAFNRPENMHHAQDHLRRVEKLTEKFLAALHSHYPEMFDYPEVQRDIDAAMVFPYYHDIDQIMTAEENIQRVQKGLPKLSEKKGHGVGGAISMLAMAPDYATLNGIPEVEAFETMAITAVMQMQHDMPEGYDESFDPINRKAYSMLSDGRRELLRGEELLALFQARQLDLFSLAPSQLMEIHRLQKERSGFVEKTGSSYGYVKPMEDQFHEQFEALRHNDEPLLEGIYERRKQMIRNLALINYYADAGDMISPPFEQLTRSLETQYSHERPFSIFHNMSSISVEIALFKVYHAEGNGLGSDDLRILWEAVNVGELSQNTIVSELPEIQEFFQENTLMGLMYLHDVGMGILRGDWEPLEQGYANRIKRLRERAHRNVAAGKVNGDIQIYSQDTEQRVHQITKDKEALIKSVMHKHKENGIRYTPHDVNKFSELVQRVILDLVQKWKISEEKITELHQKYEKGENPNGMSHGVDSVPRNKIRTSNGVV